MKNAIYLILLFGAIGWTFSGFMSDESTANGTETRNVEDFSVVDVSAGIQATLVASGTTKVKLETKNCDPSDVKTVVDGNRLIIKFKKSKWGSSKRKVYATVHYKKLEGLNASSGSSIKTDNTISTDEMDINASSGASINAHIECEKLSVDVSSGASVQLKGECKDQDIDVSSGANYRAIELASEVADVSASSGGNIKIWVTKELEADVSSGGNVKYKGDPSTKDIDSGLSGSVKKM